MHDLAAILSSLGSLALIGWILIAVIQLRLNEEVREKLGIAYSPGSAANSSSVFPDYGFQIMLAEKQISADLLAEIQKQQAAWLAGQGQSTP